MKRLALMTLTYAILVAIVMIITWAVAWYAIGIWRHPTWTPVLATIAGIPYWMVFGPLLLLSKPNDILDTAAAGIICAITMCLFWGFLTALITQYVGVKLKTMKARGSRT